MRSRRIGSTSPRVAIVVSRYHAPITDALLRGAILAYEQRCGSSRGVVVIDAPGAFELPALALACAKHAKVSGVLALGCIVKGETMHDSVIAHAVAQGLTDITLATGVPVALGVLTVETMAQAQARAGGTHGNKGEEAMGALLDTIAQIATIKAGPKGPAQATSVRVLVSAAPTASERAKRAGARSGSPSRARKTEVLA